MAKKDKRIDAYSKGSAPFAQPILNTFWELVHKACLEVAKTIKWCMASFDYKGPFVSVAAFKEHCSFGFWKCRLIEDKHGYLRPIVNKTGKAIGNFGLITSLKNLPADGILRDYIRQAKRWNDEGIKKPCPKIRKTTIARSSRLYAYSNTEINSMGDI